MDNKEDLKFKTRLPSEEVPSGKSTNLFPLDIIFLIWSLCSPAFIIFLSINKVSCNLAKKPNKGQEETSDLAIKLIFVKEDRIEISNHDA